MLPVYRPRLARSMKALVAVIDARGFGLTTVDLFEMPSPIWDAD
jgi:hypothetical protein